MNRRDFFKGFTAATVGALLLPERKIWALDKTMTQNESSWHYVTPYGTISDQDIARLIPFDKDLAEVKKMCAFGGICQPAFTTNIAATGSLTMEEFLNGIHPAYNASIGYN